jgi:hypothetical protein
MHAPWALVFASTHIWTADKHSSKKTTKSEETPTKVFDSLTKKARLSTILAIFFLCEALTHMPSCIVCMCSNFSNGAPSSLFLYHAYEVVKVRLKNSGMGGSRSICHGSQSSTKLVNPLVNTTITWENLCHAMKLTS